MKLTYYILLKKKTETDLQNRGQWNIWWTLKKINCSYKLYCHAILIFK